MARCAPPSFALSLDRWGWHWQTCAGPCLRRLCLQGKLEAVRGGIAGASAELQSGLARRQAVAAARALLELMQV